MYETKQKQMHVIPSLQQSDYDFLLCKTQPDTVSVMHENNANMHPSMVRFLALYCDH